MGLDMYLTKKHYVKNWDHMKPEERHTVTVVRGDGQPTSIDPTRVVYVEEEAAYWRKANAIHGWFVRHVQDGVDDCKAYYVDREALHTLLDQCTRVMLDPDCAPVELPTQSGFLFGDTNYDSNYRADLQETITQLTKALSVADEGEFYYQASW